MWKTSVQQEAKELFNKITKLEAFIKSDNSSNLSVDMLFLLVQQLQHMEEYHKVLVQRLELAEQESVES